jgi:hypothetical protein
MLFIFNFIFLNQVMELRVKYMVFNATFNNISAISWRSVVLVEKAGMGGPHSPGHSSMFSGSSFGCIRHQIVCPRWCLIIDEMGSLYGV